MTIPLYGRRNGGCRARDPFRVCRTRVLAWEQEVSCLLGRLSSSPALNPAVQILVLMAMIIIVSQKQGLKFSVCTAGNAWVPQIILNHQIRVHLICILNNQSENAKGHKYATGGGITRPWKFFHSAQAGLDMRMFIYTEFASSSPPFCLEDETPKQNHQDRGHIRSHRRMQKNRAMERD